MKYSLILCLFMLACNAESSDITITETPHFVPDNSYATQVDGMPYNNLLDNNYGKMQDQFKPILLVRGLLYSGPNSIHPSRPTALTIKSEEIGKSGTVAEAEETGIGSTIICWNNCCGDEGYCPGSTEDIYEGEFGPYDEYIDFTEQGGMITSGSIEDDTSVNDHYDPTADDVIICDGTNVLVYRNGEWVRKCSWHDTMQDLLSLIREPEIFSAKRALTWEPDETDDPCQYANYNEKLCLQAERRVLDEKIKKIEEKERQEEQRRILIRNAEQLLRECQ